MRHGQLKQTSGTVINTVPAKLTDDAQAFGTTTRVISKLATTTASKPWTWSAEDVWKSNTWYESPDISGILQEIVNRPGWAAGNGLALIYTSDQDSFGDERRFWSYDGDPTKAAKLVITYQPK